MTDLSLLGGALGLGTQPSFDPGEAKGYLTELKSQGDKSRGELTRRRAATEGELSRDKTALESGYDDTVARRRAVVGNMQSIVDEATKALLEARQNRSSLPMLAAGSAMMMPSSTGGLGASLGAAGLTAAPYIAADRKSADEDIMRRANLRSLPLTMGDSLESDIGRTQAARLANTEAGQDAHRKLIETGLQQDVNTNQTQQGAVVRGMLTANATGMKAVQKEMTDMRKQAGLEAKNRMAAAIRDGTTYEGDNAEVEGKLTEAIYAQMFKDRYGVWPAQHAAGIAGKELSPAQLETGVPKMPRSVPKETKQERDTYTSIANLGNTAENNLSSLDFAQPPPGQQVPGMMSGPALWASRLAEAVGLEGDWGKKIAEAGTSVGAQQAIMRNFVLTMQQQQKGVQTEGDAKRMSEAIVNTTNTEQLNKLMYSWMRSQALSAQWQADVADSYVKANKNRASGINEHMNQHGRLPLVRPGPNGAKVTLSDYVDGFTKQHPDLKRDEAQKQAIEMWNTL